ncbi:hypothetical protein H312_01988 [Anncaliia algerae PRA339]|uniref:CAP-Gly domain-containing protein n=1 Tax=Anncaliia algerae PRA339 TaxID=1288291 RepID=A0A059F022_9MICR|nr:hypothetical protein H312_01988 [Anncaliia algerae PRA339]
MEFTIGQRIECLDEYRGEVAYIGKLKGRESLYVGIRLDKPVGKNSGMYLGERYFIAGKNHGIFVKYEHIKELEKTNKILQNTIPELEEEISKIGPFSLEKAAKILSHNKDETIYMDETNLDINNLENGSLVISKNVNDFLSKNRIDFQRESDLQSKKQLSKHEKGKEYYKLLKERQKVRELNEYLKEDTSLVEGTDMEKEKETKDFLYEKNTITENKENSLHKLIDLCKFGQNESNLNKITNNLNDSKINSSLKNDTFQNFDQKVFYNQNPRKMEEELKLFKDSRKSIETINDNMRSVQRDLEEAERELKVEIKKRKDLEEMIKNRVKSVIDKLRGTLQEVKECFTKVEKHKSKEKGNLNYLLSGVINSLEEKNVKEFNKNFELFKNEVSKKGIVV